MNKKMIAAIGFCAFMGTTTIAHAGDGGGGNSNEADLNDAYYEGGPEYDEHGNKTGGWSGTRPHDSQTTSFYTSEFGLMTVEPNEAPGCACF